MSNILCPTVRQWKTEWFDNRPVKQNRMSVENQYKQDVEAILARRYDNGDDYWTGTDGRLAVGHPFSTVACVQMLSELGLDLSNDLLRGAVELILDSWREDGRFQLAPSGTLYPCYTAGTARILCGLGYAHDERLKATFNHLLEIQHNDGGWRCKKFSYATERYHEILRNLGST